MLNSKHFCPKAHSRESGQSTINLHPFTLLRKSIGIFLPESAQPRKRTENNKSGLFLPPPSPLPLPPQTVAHEREMIWRVFAKRPKSAPGLQKMALISQSPPPVSEKISLPASKLLLPLVITMDGWGLPTERPLNSPPFQMITSAWFLVTSGYTWMLARLSSVCLHEPAQEEPELSAANLTLQCTVELPYMYNTNIAQTSVWC